MNLKTNIISSLLIATFCLLVFAGPLNAQTIPREKLVFYTQSWHGERFPNGRPKVSKDILKRMKYVTIEEAWGYLRSRGYYNQYEGDWTILHPGQPIIGRALTAQYMPSRPAMQKRIVKRGHKNGRSGQMNSWPIEELRPGDVYVADGYGKVKNGTLIGDRLAAAIYANSGNGVILNGGARDLAGLEKIEGFNAFVRGWHPTFLTNMMLTGLNVPIRIGHATVLPGDVVLAKKEGVVFIPAYLAAEVVRSSEVTRLTDAFAHQRVQDGTYTAGQMDKAWTKAIKKDFFNWLDKNKSALHKRLHVPMKLIKHIIQTESLKGIVQQTENPN